MKNQCYKSFTRRWFDEWMSEPMRFGRASNLMSDLIQYRPEEAWQRTLALIAETEDEGTLKIVGAGPLEDLIREYSDVFIDRAETLASVDWRFRIALSNVIVSTSVDATMWKRIRSAVSNEKEA